MKISWKPYLIFSLAVVLLGLVGGLVYVNQQPDTQEQTALYVTVAAQPLPNENSSYELQRAGEHFSDLLLGWTVEPSFTLSDEVSFTGRRQEKQNLLFMIDSSDAAYSDELLTALESRIDTYNTAAQSSYVIADHHTAALSTPLNKMRIVLGFVLGALMLSIALIFTHDSVRRYRH